MEDRADICVNLGFAGFVLENMLSKGKYPELERHHGKRSLPRKNMVTTNYSVGDFLIRVKNVAMAKNKEVTIKPNKEILAVAEALKKMGFVDEIKKEKDSITVALTFKDKKPRLMDLKLISKPGLRIYMGVDELEKKKSPSVFLVSTPKGMMSSLKAIKDRVGGEVLAEIW